MPLVCIDMSLVTAKLQLTWMWGGRHELKHLGFVPDSVAAGVTEQRSAPVCTSASRLRADKNNTSTLLL